MKKLIFGLMLVFGLSPLVVKACSLANPPSGFELKINDCEYGDSREYLFDVMFEKDGIDTNLYSQSIDYEQMNNAWSDQELTTLDYELPYMALDNDYISLLAYGTNIEQAYHNNCFQAIYRSQIFDPSDPNPYPYEDFYIIVLDMDYNILYSSEVYSKDVLPYSTGTYSRFIYNSETNEITTETHDMFYPTIDDCGIFYADQRLWSFLVYGAFVLVALVLVTEPLMIFFRTHEVRPVLISLVVNGISLFLILIIQTRFINVIILTMILLLLLQVTKYLLVKKNTLVFDQTDSVRLIIYSAVVIVASMMLILTYAL